MSFVPFAVVPGIDEWHIMPKDVGKESPRIASGAHAAVGCTHLKISVLITAIANGKCFNHCLWSLLSWAYTGKASTILSHFARG